MDEQIITAAEITAQSPLQKGTLVPGKYKVTVLLLSKTPFTIPEKAIEGGHGATIPKLSFDHKSPFIEGTLSLGETADSVFEITPEDLYSDKDLVVYAYAAVQPIYGVVHEELSHLDAAEFLKTNKNHFYPVFQKKE